VLKGFIIGLALTIVAGQLPELFGVEKGEGDFFEELWDLLTKLGDTSGLTLLVGLVSLALVLGLRRFAPAVPGSLVAVLFGIAAVGAFSLDEHGVAIVGHIDRGLPSLGLPGARADDYLKLASSGVGILLVAFAEELGAAKTYAARHHYEVDANRELLGLGAANLGAGLFEGLPKATLAAVVIAAVIELVDFPALVELYRVGTVQLRRLYGVAARPDFIAALAALAGVLVFDTLPGLFIGIGVSLLLLLYRASRPHVAVLGEVPGARGQYVDVARHPENWQVEGVVVLRVEGGLFFANADTVRDAIRMHAAEPGTRAVVLDAETVPFVDVSAARQ
jgi:sulfate permease, SulP family